MSKPNINIPAEFAVNGIKTDFDNSKLLDGFDKLNPDVLAGDNLNKFIDDTYKGLNGVLELYEGCILYDSTVTYTNKSLVFDITNDGIKFYHSLQNGNINHALTDTDYWEEVNLGGSSRNIGEIVASTIPLTDAGLHLLDGTLIQGSGSYSAFVDYIAGLVGTYPTLFDTEANWQTAITTYGVCGKFVYDSVNNTVRLPKYSNKIYTQELDTTAPVVGNGKSLGLTNGTYEGSFGTRDGWGNGDSRYFQTVFREGLQNKTVGTDNGLGFTSWFSTATGVSQNAANSGLIAQLSDITTSLDGYYYIVIATSTKTDIEVDIDEIATDLNGKADVDLTNVTNTSGFRKLVELYNNGASWYKVFREYDPSTGNFIGLWCEQGGTGNNTASAVGTITTTLLKNYVDTNYTVQLTRALTGTTQNISVVYKTNSGFQAQSANAPSGLYYWVACGYIA